MEITRKEEARALDAEERAMVAPSHHPALAALPDAELATLVRRVRDRRDRAQTLAKRKRREMRGKAAPRGDVAATQDRGDRVKLAALAAAMRRLNGEASRRRRMSSRLTMMESQKRALQMVRSTAPDHAGFNTRTAHDGMRSIEKTKVRRIGSAKEAGRVSQFVKNAQAKRDAR